MPQSSINFTICLHTDNIGGYNMKMKTNQRALILLVIMFIGFIITLFPQNTPIITILQSGFEAGVVGGFSDWFAVVALFRYPLGIPIPHTALLPRNRKRITEGLVSIVENNLLNKSSIINKVHELEVVKKILNICKKIICSKQGIEAGMYVIKRVIEHIPIEKVSSSLLKLIQKYLNTLDSKNFLEKLIGIFLRNNYEEKILDNLLIKLEEIVKQDKVKNELGNIVFNSINKLKISGIMQYSLNTVLNVLGKDKVGKIARDLVVVILKDLKKHDNTSRITLLELMQSNIRNISNNEEVIQKIDEYKMRLGSNVELNNFTIKILDELKNTILGYVKEDYIRDNILPMLNNLIDSISEDINLINKLEQQIQERVSGYINSNHENIGRLVRDNIERLDTETLIKLIEERVGDDLQWIRINGAICGFCVGLVLGIIRVL